MATAKQLSVNNLCVDFSGARAVENLNLAVDAGEIVVLLGGNGAGKTSTLRAVSGLHRPSSGAVTFGGVDLGGRSPDQIARLGLAHVPEGRRLFGRMTVEENLELGLLTRSRKSAAGLARAFDYFPELARLRSALAFSLSGGEQQMVALARALIVDPEIIMLDEPSLGLAPVMVDRIMATVTALKQAGTGVLLVEQDTSVALQCADRGYVLANGNVIASGTSAELRSNSKVTEAYIGR